MRTILLSRPEKKAATRERLITAGRKLFLQRGFHGATLEEIGLEAGVTKGAVYSNFKDKSDLYLAVLDAHVERGVRACGAGSDGPPDLGELARNYARAVLQDGRLAPRWSALLVEVWTYAAADPMLRSELLRRHERLLEAAGQMVEQAASQSSVEFRVSCAEVARYVSAFARGLLLERLLEPQNVTDDAFEAALAGLFRSLVRARQSSKSPVNVRQHTRGV